MNEMVEGLAGVGCLHEGLADEEAPEACLAQLSDGVGVADAALADLDGILGQQGGQTEGVLDIGMEGAEVAIVDATEVRAQFRILQLALVVHLQEHFQP